jgi:hypothetical protein
MTDLQTLNVEYEELMARAEELAAPIAGLPPENGQPPCALEMVVRAAQQLGLSADNMRAYLNAGERERGRLAQSLRNAAKAYEETDEGAAEALNNETSVSAVTPGLADRDVQPAMLTDTVSLMAAEPLPYYSVREAAEALARGDQGTSFLSFADAWTAHQRSLLEASYRFRPFIDWNSSTASLLVDQNFDQHRQWLDQMARLCAQMATQARGVVSAHRWAVTEHPTAWQIQQIDGRWLKYQGTREWPEIKPQLLAYYAKYQEKSEEVLAEYEKRAALPLPPVSPPRPAAAYKIDAPPAPRPEPEPGPGPWPGPGPEPGPLPLPDDGLPSAGTDMPGLPLAGMPSMPTDSQPTDSKLTEALKDFTRSPGPSLGAGLKPASVGGGGAGVPSMPLRSWVDSEAESRRPAAAPGGMGPGRGIPGAGGALGGGGMGIPPMGAPGGQGQGAGKGKRTQQDNKALYTEERPWTEAVIGRLRT